MALSFSHNSHHQAISQKNVKKAQCKIVNLYRIQFTFTLIFINSFNVINSLKMRYL